MAIVFSRCYALFKEKKISYMPNQGQQMQIGLAIARKFQDKNDGKKATKIQAPQFVGDFKVAYYPANFSPEIDKTIIDFVNGKKFKNAPKPKQHAGNYIKEN